MPDAVKSNDLLKPVMAGLLTGCVSTAIFNPMDQALFLMIKEQKSFFNPSLWKNPYSGVSRALYGRIISYGVNLTLFDFYSNLYKDKSNHPLLLASISTAISTVGLSHGVNVLKMYQWSHPLSSSLLESTKIMVTVCGWSTFFRGLPETCARDCVFSANYFVLSDTYNSDRNFGISVALASTSTALSSPFNYLRSRQFFDFHEKRPSLKIIFKELSAGIKSHTSVKDKVAFVLHKQLNIGLGTLRVGVGMAVAEQLYKTIKVAFD